MAIVTLREPYKSFIGSICKADKYYVRFFRGHFVIQRKPTKRSNKQKAMREEFGRRWAGKHGPS